MKYLTILLLFGVQLSFAQSPSLTRIVDEIDYQEDTLRAVFDWMADNIKYDVAKLKKLEKGVNFYKKGNYKSTQEYKADLLEKVIKRKKGVCDDYTLLFHSIVSELGYTSYIIEGVTKDQNGNVRRRTGHSWNAVKVDGEWKLFDPTWGSGYVNDKRRFVQKYFERWYDVDPEEMQKTHLPYDPIWQLSTSPITYKEFENGQIGNTGSGNFDFANLITEYLSKEEKEQKMNILVRSRENGGSIRPIQNYRKHLENKINYLNELESAQSIQSTMEVFRETSDMFGEYIQAKNQRFRGAIWTKEHAKIQLDKMENDLATCIESFQSIKINDPSSQNALKSFVKNAKELVARVQKEKKYLNSRL